MKDKNYKIRFVSILMALMVLSLPTKVIAAGIVWSEGFTGLEWQNHTNNSLFSWGQTIQMKRGKTYNVWIYNPGINVVPFRNNYNINIPGTPLLVKKEASVNSFHSNVVQTIVGRHGIGMPGIGLRVTTRPNLRIGHIYTVKAGWPALSTAFKVQPACGPWEDTVQLPLSRVTISRSRLQANREATLKLQAEHKIECQSKRFLIKAPQCFQVFSSNGNLIADRYLNWEQDDPATLSFKVKAKSACNRPNYTQHIQVIFEGGQKSVDIVWSKSITAAARKHTSGPHRNVPHIIRH